MASESDDLVAITLNVEHFSHRSSLRRTFSRTPSAVGSEQKRLPEALAKPAPVTRHLRMAGILTCGLASLALIIGIVHFLSLRKPSIPSPPFTSPHLPPLAPRVHRRVPTRGTPRPRCAQRAAGLPDRLLPQSAASCCLSSEQAAAWGRIRVLGVAEGERHRQDGQVDEVDGVRVLDA